MANIEKKDRHINVSPLSNKTQKNIYKEQLREKRAETQERNSPKTQKAILETYDRLAEQENRRREEINKIIKEQGYYNGPNGEHYEKKLKMVKGKDLAAQQKTKIIKPSKVKKLNIWNRISIAVGRTVANTANLLVNGLNRHEKPLYDKAIANGNPVLGANAARADVSQANQRIAEYDRNAMQLAKDLYHPEVQVDVVNAKKEMQYWMNRNKINDKAPRDIMFDFMKAATLQNMVTNESGISEILTYAMENKCEYNAETGNILMCFKLKNGEIGNIGIDDKGNIFIPESIIIDNRKVENPITAENIKDKMPEKVIFLAEQIKASPNLLQQFTNEEGFSRESLKQVREYLEKHNISAYDEHVNAIEQRFVDRSAIRAFNEFVTRASFMGNLPKVDDVINFSFIKPAQTMSQMANPGQYVPVFNQACDQLIKGVNPKEAFEIAETLLIKKGEELTIVPRETQKILVAHIDELQRFGMAAPEVTSIIQSYNQSNAQMAEINKKLINIEISNNVSLKDIINTKRETEVNIEAIAKQIVAEVEKLSRDTIMDDVKHNGGRTISGVYLSHLKPNEVLLVAQQIPEGDNRDSFMVVAGLQQEEKHNDTVVDIDNQTIIEDDAR